MVTILRPLSTSELLDRTFHLYRNNFLLFVGITAIPQLAALAWRLAAARQQVSNFDHASNSMGNWLAIVTGITSFGAIEVAHAGTVVAVSNLHLGRPATIASSYSFAKPSLLRVVAISLAAISIPILIATPFALVLFGFFAIFVFLPIVSLASTTPLSRVLPFLLPVSTGLIGLRWWIAWALVVPVTVLEGAGLRATMSRSRELTEGSRGRIFLIYLLIAVLAWVISSAIQFPLLALFGWNPLQGSLNVGFAAYAARTAATFLGTSLVGALGAIALTLVYYDLRVRKEGFDLQLMMSSLKSESQPAPAPVS